MTKKHIRRILIAQVLLIANLALVSSREPSLAWMNDVGAKSFPDTTNVYTVNDFGAINNGLILATEAIQQAIDKCAANGGGRVAFEPGVYLTGAVFLKSNVNLHIDKDVEIRGVIGLEEYPDIHTRVAGIMMDWPAAIINVLEQENVALSGTGTIHAQGRYHWERYWKMRTEYTPKGLRWASDYDCKRVRTILVSDSKDVTVKDMHLKQAGFWTIHILFSSHITVDGVHINNNIDGHGPSTDGIDIDSSSRILVQNCKIDCNDDNVCLKAGRDADGLRVNRPTEFVVVRNCISYQGGGLITFGSETSGGIRHVVVDNLEAYGTTTAIRLKSALSRGGELSDIYISNIRMENVRIPLEVTLNWNPSYSYASVENEVDDLPDHWIKLLEPVAPEDGIPVFRNVTLSNITATGAEMGLNVSGTAKSYLENFTLKNIQITSKEAGRLSYTKDWTFKNVEIISENGEGLDRKENINMTSRRSAL
jgi:polygalacturonase